MLAHHAWDKLCYRLTGLWTVCASCTQTRKTAYPLARSNNLPEAVSIRLPSVSAVKSVTINVDLEPPSTFEHFDFVFAFWFQKVRVDGCPSPATSASEPRSVTT